MSNVIGFLERMGQDALLRHASHGDIEVELANAMIGSDLKAAILAKDQARLEVLLGSVNVCCLVNPDKDDDDEDTEESPSRENEEITTHFASRTMSSAA